MSNIAHILAEIVKHYKTAIVGINELREKLTSLITDKTKKYAMEIEEYVTQFSAAEKSLKAYDIADAMNNSTDSLIELWFSIINHIEICSLILENIHKTLEKFLSKTQNTEVYLSQSYINEAYASHKQVSALYNKMHVSKSKKVEELIQELISYELGRESIKYTTKYIKSVQRIFTNSPFSATFYCKLMAAILKELPKWYPGNQQLYFYIVSQIELDKDRILTRIPIKEPDPSRTQLLNPYYKTFGLIPHSKSLQIKDISEKIFKTPSNSFAGFVKLCKSKDYGLILMNKHIVHPITYHTDQLIDFKQSMDYAQIHKPSYGVDKAILDRLTTIDKIKIKSKWNFSIEPYVLTFSDYEVEKERFVIILDSLAPDHYRILTNYMRAETYFVRVSSIRELYEYCNKPKNSLPVTRIYSYNALCQQTALNNIFAPVKVDIEKLKEVATIVDPKYLRNRIYLALIDGFKDIMNKKYKGETGIKDNYTYASIIHDDKFLNIFSQILTQEFHVYLYKTYNEYTTGHLHIAEIIGSFLNVIYLYQRTFVKEIHDSFKNNTYNFKADAKPGGILKHFDDIVREVLGKIITSESNIYHTILYKINLLKSTLI